MKKNNTKKGNEGKSYSHLSNSIFSCFFNILLLTTKKGYKPDERLFWSTPSAHPYPKKRG